MLISIPTKIFSGLEYSASAPFYDKIDQGIEKWTENAYFVITNVTLFVSFVPKILFSIYVYFVVGLSENDTFELPFPTW